MEVQYSNYKYRIAKFTNDCKFWNLLMDLMSLGNEVSGQWDTIRAFFLYGNDYKTTHTQKEKKRGKKIRWVHKTRILKLMIIPETNMNWYTDVVVNNIGHYFCTVVDSAHGMLGTLFVLILLKNIKKPHSGTAHLQCTIVWWLHCSVVFDANLLLRR